MLQFSIFIHHIMIGVIIVDLLDKLLWMKEKAKLGWLAKLTINRLPGIYIMTVNNTFLRIPAI